MPVTRVELEIGGRTLSIETGKLAKQADGAVLVQYGETVVLGTVVVADPRPDVDFFPLTVDYRERLSAAGKFPGGFRKREGAPNQKEVLTMRNIDRPIRPLFPEGYYNEVQIQCWVMAADGQNEPDVLAGIAASAALAISSVPFQGPVGNVRVGRIDGQFVIMPTVAQAEYSDLDMLLCGHSTGLNMIEVGALQIPEAEVYKACEFGWHYVKQITSLIQDLAAKAGKPKVTPPLDVPSPELLETVRRELAEPLRAALTSQGTKLQRKEAASKTIKAYIASKHPEPSETATVKQIEAWKQAVKHTKAAIAKLEEKVIRQNIVRGTRSDGRKVDQLRQISGEVGILPRVHGSSLFTRGETQALATITLGTAKDEQIVDGIHEEYAEKFYLHYNFPPFSVGEAKRITGPGRREIGHGMLAQRALQAVMPPVEQFPYTVRVVSDILESNGSSSMASACAGSLALMDAGVPIVSPVAGISIGLVQEDGQQIFLTDIAGEEDHHGDMDFKVTGTRQGITAIQLDLKTHGLTLEQIAETFTRARAARLQILDIMQGIIAEPRSSISKNAPRLLMTTIHPDKIGRLIGPGGKTIRGLEALTGATIEIEEDGTVIISAVGADKAERALEEVEKLCMEVKVGQIYSGKVVGIKDFGAFIELAPGVEGLCHISELDFAYVDKVTNVVTMGQEVRAKVILVDDQGRIKLSRKQAMKDAEPKDGQPAGKA